MMNNGFSITVEDAAAMHTFKDSAAYSTYLKAIASSPAFTVMMNEHINDVDVTEDVKLLKNSGQLPDSVSAKALSTLFKQSLSRMAIGLVADTIILKELETHKINEVLQGIKEDTNITYLLGKADKKFYEQAAKMVEQGKVDKNSLIFKGLLAYMKNSGVLKEQEQDIIKVDPPRAVKKKAVKKQPAERGLDMDSDDIRL